MSQDRRNEARWLWTLALGLALIAGPTAGAAGSTPYLSEQETKITPDPIGEDDRFAHGMAVDEDRLVLGSHNAGDGEVYVYERTEAQPELRATIAAPTGFENFGEALALEDDTLVVGAPSTDTADVTASGAALVYEHANGGWSHVETLASTDPGTIERFGSSLALENGLLAVGEPEDSPDGYDSNGAVHVYEAGTDGFQHQTKLTPPDDEDKERLGFRLALEHGTLYVGAPEDEGHPDVEASYEGAVYVYDDGEGSWSLTQRLTAPEDSDARQFGRALAVEGATMVVGAPGPQASICCSPVSLSQQGHAFAFEDTDEGWQLASELQPAASTEGANVGYSVALTDSQAYVASPTAPADTVIGLVGVFEPGTTGDWHQTGQIRAEDPASGDRLGAGLAAEGETLFAAAPGDDEAGHNAGAVYAFAEASPQLSSTSEGPASSQACISPVDGVEVCENDEDPRPEGVHVSLEDEAAGSVEASYLEETYWGWTLRQAQVHVVPSAGENETHATVTCWQGPDAQLVCNEAHVQALVDDGTHSPPVRVDGDCYWVSTDDGSLCGTLRVRGATNLEEGPDASTSLTCSGGFGGQCPDRVQSSTVLETPEGTQRVSVFASAGGLGICLTGPADAGCVSAP